MSNSPLLTLGDVVDRIRALPGLADVTLSRTKYAIAEYRVSPRQRAGVLRLWAEDDVPTIASAIRRIDSRKGVVNA